MVPGVLDRIKPSCRRRRAARWVTMLVATGVTALAPGVSAAETATGCWVMDVPVYAEARDSMAAGTQLDATVRIVNGCSHPVVLTLRSGRTVTGDDGAPAWSPLVDAAGSARFDREQVTVEPGGSEVVGVTVSAASDAEPGDHPLAVSAAEADAPANPVRWQSIPLRVDGEQRQRVEIGDIAAAYHSRLNPFAPGSADIAFTVANTGTATISGQVLAGLGGLYSLRADADFAHAPTVVLVPGAIYRGSVRIDRVWPAVRFDAQVGFRPTAISGSPVDYATPAVQNERTLWALPVGQILVAILLGTTLFVLALARRDRHLRRARIPATTD